MLSAQHAHTRLKRQAAMDLPPVSFSGTSPGGRKESGLCAGRDPTTGVGARQAPKLPVFSAPCNKHVLSTLPSVDLLPLHSDLETSTEEWLIA